MHDIDRKFREKCEKLRASLEYCPVCAGELETDGRSDLTCVDHGRFSLELLGLRYLAVWIPHSD